MSAAHWIASLTPVALMLGMIAINHLINSQRTDRKTEVEASRLRCALAAELRGLLDLYEKNLQLIEQKADYILSSRSSVVMYRASLHRISMLLDESLIERVVNVFAQNERIEATLSAHSNFKGGLTYQFAAADADYPGWQAAFEQAWRDAKAVCEMLVGWDKTAIPVRCTLRWQFPGLPSLLSSSGLSTGALK